MPKKVLIVLTSHDKLGDTGEKTGFWLEELAAPYLAFRDAGLDVTLASPAGGEPPIDPKSTAEDAATGATRRFLADDDAMAALKSTVPLAEVRADDHDAIFYPGGHGPLWDLVDDSRSIGLIEAFWRAGRPVGAVCHGPIVLANAVDAEGRPIVADRSVTGFSNAEEEAVSLTEVVPHAVEDVLKARDGHFTSAPPFAPHAVRDGNLVTGQNPASSDAAARHLLEALAVPAAAG